MRKPTAAVSAQAAAGRNPPTGSKVKPGKKTPAKKLAGRNPPTGKSKN